MSDVQTENGYTRIANELLDEIVRFNFTGRQQKILLAVIRKTYGYNKKADDISLKQFEDMTGIARRHVCVTIKELTSMNVLKVHDGKHANHISLNKNYSHWGVPKLGTDVPKIGTPKIGTGVPETGTPNLGIPESGTGCSQNGNGSVPKSGTEAFLNREPQKTTPKDNSKDNSKIKTPAVAVDPNFEKFWLAYNYKIGKHKALKVWKSINPDAELVEKIVKAAEFYAYAKNGSPYYKHAETWLRNHHWEDDPDAVMPKIARIQPTKTEHQIRQDAVARSIFGHLYQNPANAVIEGDVIDATENATPRLG